MEIIHTHHLASQNVVPRSSPLASSGALLETQKLVPHPDLIGHNLHCKKLSGLQVCALGLEKHLVPRAGGWAVT